MIEYDNNAEFTKQVMAMLDNKVITELSPIREQGARILSVLVIQTDKEGEHVERKGSPITCRKIPPVYQLLTNGHYLVVADYYFWTHANDRQRDAALHRALMQINIERSKKGNITLKTRKPEICEFRATAARFGAWNDTLLDFNEALKSAANQFVQSQKPKL